MFEKRARKYLAERDEQWILHDSLQNENFDFLSWKSESESSDVGTDPNSPDGKWFANFHVYYEPPGLLVTMYDTIKKIVNASIS